MELFLIILWGLCIGSFLNVCIYRIPRDYSVAAPPSHCLSCGTRIKFYDLIPVISYLVLQGKCRHCGVLISPRYAIVELITAILFVLCQQVSNTPEQLIQLLILTSFLIIITFIDLDHQLILDKLLIWFAGLGFIINILFGYIAFWDMLIASLAGGGILLFIAVITRGGMGGGDIKFIAALGLWLGLKITLLTLFLSFIIGGIVGAFLLLLKLKGRKDFIPFGPYIAIAAFISLLYGHNIITWYFQYMTR